MARPPVRNIERRSQRRGAPPAEPTRAHLISMIIGAYREMPGLSLQLQQAVRLFGISPTACELVLDQLVSMGRLRKTEDGQYRLP